MRHWFAIASFALVVLGSASAFAASTPELSIDQLSAASDVIVTALVSEVRAEVIDGRVVTHTSFHVHSRVAGVVGDELTVSHLGGRTDGLATWVPGMPTFSLGDVYLLFLESRRGPHGTYFVVTGLSQGARLLVKGPDGQTSFAVGIDAPGAHDGEVPIAPDPVPLDELLSRASSAWNAARP